MTCGRSEVAMGNLWILLAVGGVMAAVIGCLTLLNNRYTLNNIKSKTVGDGQHGTARWATDTEIRKTSMPLCRFKLQTGAGGCTARKRRGSPEEAQEIALPFRSVIVTMVLLKEERI